MKTNVIILIIFILLNITLLIAQTSHVEIISDKFNNQVVVERNTITNGVNRITNISVNTLNYGMYVGNLDEQVIKEITPKLLIDYSNILGISQGDLKVKKIVVADGKWYVTLYQTFKDVPIWKSEFGFTIESNGNIYTMGGSIYPNLTLASVQPWITAVNAVDNAKTAFQKYYNELNGTIEDDITLQIYPRVVNNKTTYYLAWSVVVSSWQPREKMQYLIDANSGLVLLEKNIIKHENINVTVTKQYWPQHDYDDPVNDGG